MTRTFVPALVAGLLLVTATGCSGDDDQGADEKSAQESPSSVDPGRVSPKNLTKVPEVKQGKGAINDATFGDCATDPGKQTVEGSVTNSTKKAGDYVITVNWVNDTSDVLARGVTVVEDLQPGATEEFDLSAKVPETVTTCTFHVVKGSLS